MVASVSHSQIMVASVSHSQVNWHIHLQLTNILSCLRFQFLSLFFFFFSFRKMFDFWDI